MTAGTYAVFIVIWSVFILAAVLALIRLIRGPSLPDRVMALDLISMLLAGVVLVHSVFAGEAIFFDVVVIISLVVFFATVSFSLYIQRRGES
jgi:multicomponent Na+:H+ antiporter subunit F